jgi:hypothetical protein
MSFALEGLNPRLVGDQLILSLAQPATPAEASGIGGSHISTPQLSMLRLGGPEELQQATNAADRNGFGLCCPAHRALASYDNIYVSMIAETDRCPEIPTNGDEDDQ